MLLVSSHNHIASSEIATVAHADPIGTKIVTLTLL